jgi:hypothetical protein
MTDSLRVFCDSVHVVTNQHISLASIALEYSNFVFAFINILIAIMMFVVTRNSYRLAKQAFESSKRPFINLSYKTPPKSKKKQKLVRFSVDIENLGSIPAKNISCDVEGILGDKIIHTYSSSSKSTLVPTVFPNRTLNITYLIIQNDDLESYYNGALLKIISKIKYDGLNTNNHETTETCNILNRFNIVEIVEADCT